MIGIGINPRTVLKNATLDDKKNLQLVFAEASDKEPEEFNPFDRANSAEISDDGDGLTLRIWTLKVPDDKDKKGRERTDEDKLQLVQSDLDGKLNVLKHILQNFMTTDDMRSVFDVFADTGLTREAYAADPGIYNRSMIMQPTLDIISNNMFTQFIAAITPHLNKNTQPFRLKLRRQSKDKAFATLPDKYLKEYPFIEPSSVPEDQSRVKFSPYEVKEGLNDSSAPSRDEAEKTTTQAPSDTESMFADATESSPFGSR